MVLHCEEDGLVFRISEHTPEVISQVLSERGWTQYDEENDTQFEGSWNLWWKTQRFRKTEHDDVAPWQRLNHFPRTDAITRKDCLVRNLRRMRCVHGTPIFNFHPTAYILPNEYTKFVTDYAKESQKNGKKNLYWICKPVDLSRGRGIFVFSDLKDLNYDCSVVVQRYITNPFLISGYKFDLRIYVCVPSFQPLTIYIYQEGIVRFGTDKFDLNQLKNVFSHLTNTSINKYGPCYSTDKERVGPGCKWTLSQLRSYLRQLDSVDETLLWNRISNIITCTLATQAPSVPKCQNCFEVFGFDILIDDQMKPWLLEVNFSPALSMDCQADFIAKRSMINDLIDLLNFKERDCEHGGESYRSCPSPTSNSMRSMYGAPDIYGSKRLSARSLTGKTKPLPNRKVSTPTRKPDKSNATVEYTMSNFTLRRKESGRRKSDTKLVTSRSSSGKETNKKSTRSVSLPQIRRQSPETLDSPKNSVFNQDDFPRNMSSSSVASSISSIDQLNQPENSLEHFNDHLSLPKTSDAPSVSIGPLYDNRETVPFQHKRNNLQCLSTIVEINNANTAASGDQLRSDRLKSPLLPIKSSSPNVTRKKKSLNSALDKRQTKLSSSATSSKPSSGKTRLKSFSQYKSPYSISSTATQKSSAATPWPRTRVGDFILTFPLNEAMRKASGPNFDMKIILREQQRMLKKLNAKSGKHRDMMRRSSSSSEALQLSFHLKFEDKELNPLYFWGPQNPPLLSNVLS